MRLSKSQAVFKVFCLLAAGTAVNTAVAWKCAMWSQRGRAWEQLYNFDSPLPALEGLPSISAAPPSERAAFIE